MKFFKWVFKIGSQLCNDTLKRDKDGTRRWSKTSLTMLSAWILVCATYVYDLFARGFHMEAWLVMVGIAVGVKTTDAVSKAINKNNTTQ